MNAASASDTYVKMQNKILHDDQATCMLVETIAKRSQNEIWTISINENGRRQRYSHQRIRRVSMDKFYSIVFNDNMAFFKLCKILPVILEDVISDDDSIRLHNTVYEELDTRDFYKSLYLLAFRTYEGFENF